jgi:cytochrome c5
MRHTIAGAIATLAVVAAATFTGAVSSRSSAVTPRSSAGSSFGQDPPALGTRLTPLPEGPGKAIAEQACLACHSSDIIRQQRLTRQQWTASIAKMVNWGAAVPETQRDTLLEYLSTQFGPDNTSFQPVVARPAGR